MAWIMTQDKSELVDVVSIQLSAPAQIDRPSGSYGLIGICINKQLHNLGLFSSKERALKEMGKFAIWLRVEKGLGVFPVGHEIYV